MRTLTQVPRARIALGGATRTGILAAAAPASVAGSTRTAMCTVTPPAPASVSEQFPAASPLNVMPPADGTGTAIPAQPSWTIPKPTSPGASTATRPVPATCRLTAAGRTTIGSGVGGPNGAGVVSAAPAARAVNPAIR